MKKKVLSMILAFAIIMVQIPASVYVLATDSGIDSAVVDSANGSSTGWTIDDVLDLIDGLPQADEVADESKVEVKIALNEALAVYSAAMEQADIDAEELRDAVGDERRDKLRALSDLLSDVEIPVLDSGIDAQMQAEFEMGRLPLMSQMLLRGSSPTSAVIGSAENPFLIGTPAVLAELAELTQNNEDYGTDMLFAAANYKLVADIDLAGVDGIQRIKDFKGTFDGDGHSVKNMKIAGLFATAEAGSVIKNLGIEDCKISCEGSVGGVAMYTNGAITNCYVTGTITGTDQFIGGVAGSAGISAVVTNCYAVVDVSGVDFVGGVVGRTTGTVTNCYVTGNVSGNSMVGGVAGVAQDATIANCYVTGNVSGNSMVGGEVGWAVFTTTMTTVTNCAALGQTVTGNSDVGRVVGLNGGYGSNISGCYAFSGMKIGASGSEAVVTGGAVDNQNGADLSYTASNAESKLSAQFSAIFGSDNTAWNYTVDGLPTLNNVSGDQSSELPMWFEPTSFDISTAAQLDELRKVVNGGTSALGYTNTDDAVYNLINDIDLTGFDSDTDATNGNWAPIGNLDNPFKGTFDGKGYAVQNMTINGVDRDGGLFGYTAEKSAIKNLGVENCNVTAIAYTGGVVGTCCGTVTNCYSTGSVNGSVQHIGGVVGVAQGAITNCYSTASVSGNISVGGVVGRADRNVTGCYSTGNINGNENAIGGVVGFAQGAITNCYSTGTVIGKTYVGGVVGEALNNITNCYSTGNITANDSSAGGVVGYYRRGSITNCAALGQTVTGTINGRIVGDMESGTVSNCYAWIDMKIGTSGSEAVATDGALDNKNGADYTGGNAQFSNIFNNDTAWNYTPGALPTLADVGGSQSSALPIWIGASGNVFAISTAEQLDELRQLVNNNTPSASGYTNTAESYYYLTADIDLVESGSVTPIGLNAYWPFRGTFDGKGNAVKNMTISSTEYAGLFGCTADNSVIKNLGVENCNVTGENAGGVVGDANGVVTNCYATGTVSGNGSGSSYVGGVVGRAYGMVTNCYATGSISGGEYACVGGVVGSTYGTVTNCYATGNVSGGNYAGGVVGSTYDSVVTNCYATGSVSGSVGAGGGVVGYTSGTVTNCYATGSVTGKENAFVGGVVGVFDSSTGTVKNCAALGKAAAGVAASRIVSAIYNGTVSACYGWNGMNLSGDNIGNNGTDLTYTATNAAGARLSAQFGTIFGSDAAWSYTADALPVLADLGGSQSSELPYWVMLGAGTEENPYIISTAAQLNDLRKVVNDGATSTYGYTNAAGRFYKLNANINLSGFDDDGDSTNGNWTPIGTYEKMFLGNFDGNGYAVKQMTVQLPSTNYATGLFGDTAEGSTIKNLGVENCIVTGQYYTGGVVGNAGGTVTGCYVTGTITGNDNTGGVVGFSSAADSVTRCYSSASVNGNKSVGGVVGYSIYSVTACYASGSVTGSDKVGGVVGDSSSAVTNCVALGKTVTGNSASTGRVVGSYGFSPTNCYAWRYMKIGESSSRAVVNDGAADNKNGADLLYLTGQGLLLGDALFTWPGFAENGWDVPVNQTSMPKLPYQASYLNIPTKLVQVFTLKLNYNNGTAESKNLYSEYGEVTLPGKSSLPAMTVSDPKVFVGWDAQQSIADDAAPTYKAGDQFSLAQDTTLYAQWKTVSATINGKDADTGDYEVASCLDTLLQNQTTLTLANNTFKAAENLDIKGWFQYPPDWLTITLTAEAGSDTATITFSGTPDSTSSNLYEPINIHTSALTLPMDVEKFTSDTVHVSIYKAKPVVTWATAAQNVTYTTLETIITPPTVTLSGTDVFSGSFEYSYKADASGSVYTNGLPTAVGTYYVKAHIDADYHTNYSGADSDTDMKLTISYLQTDAVAIADGTQGENGWFTSDVTLKAPEGYSIAGSNASDASWGSSLPPFTSDTNRDYVYYLRKDSNGEITDTKIISVKQDTAAPVIGTVTYSIHQSFLDWIFHKSVIRVTVPVADTLSGADHISYVLVPDGGTPLAVQTVAVDSEGNAVFDVEKTFKGIVAITAYDKAGNASEEVASKRMSVEETAPTLVLEDAYANAYTNDWYTGTQWLYINSEDTGSGIQSVTCAVDCGDAITLFEAKETDADITTHKVNPVVVQEGAHTYTVTVTDNALNATSQMLTIKRDAIYPTVDSVTAGNITDTTLTVTAAASDDTSGVKKYYLYYEKPEVFFPVLNKDTCINNTNGTFELTSLTKNTTYNVCIWAEDTAGNIGDPWIGGFKTDKTPLEGATVALGSSSFTYDGQSHTPSAITVTLGGETLTAGTDYTVSYSNSNGGENNTTNAGTVTVTVTASESGNYTGAATGTTYTISYLQTAAVAIADGTQGENGWFTGDVTIKAPDGYDIATTNGIDAVWGSNLTPINSDTSSDYTYYLKNGNGEITDAKSILVKRDTTGPEIGTVNYSMHQSFLDWIFHKTVIRVTVPVTDTLSGADYISYVLTPDGGTPQAAQTAAVDSAGNTIFDVDKTFKGTVSVIAYDKAGNASAPTESKRVAVEETAPTLTITDGKNAFTENWYSSAQTLDINAADAGSGIQSLTCAVDGGSATTLFEAKETDGALTTSKNETVTALDGEHIYTITVIDNALNATEQTVTIKQDTVAPTVSSVTPSNITDTTLTLTAAASDGTSDVKQYYLYYKEGEASEPSFDDVKSTCLISADDAFQLTPLTRNTTYTIYVWAEDTAGNISQPENLQLKTAKTSLEGATVALGSSSFTYTGQSQTPSTITVTLGGETLTSGTDYTVSYSNSNGGAGNTTNAGTVTVTVTATASGNYTGTATTCKTYVIAPATPIVAWSGTDKAQTVTYTGSAAVITAPLVTLVNSETYSGTIQYKYKSASLIFSIYTNGLPTDAGKYLVKAHIVANGNYTAADSTNELELIIDKANATLSIKNTYTGKTYDGTPMVDPTAAQIESNITNPAVVYAYCADNSGVKGSHLSSTPVNAGTYWVEGSIPEANNTKAVTSAAVKFSIAKAPLTINGGTVAPKKWDNQATAPVESITFSGLQNSESLAFGTDYTVTGAAYEDAAVGSVKIVTSGTVELMTTDTAANYTLSDTALSGKGLTGNITKADGPAAPTFNAWGDAANTFTFNSTNGTIYEYRINSTDENGWTSVTASGGTTVISVGNVAIPAGGLEVRVKTTDTHEAGAILTNTLEQVFTASIEGGVSIDKTTGVTYGDILTATASGYQTGANLHYQWTADGSNVGTDSATYTVQRADIDKAITVTVTATGYNGSLTPETATNKVLKRAITVTADAKSKTYGQADPDFTYSITSGSLINSDILSGALSRDAGEIPNTYAIKQGTLDNLAYIITYESTDLTINKAAVTLNVTVPPPAAKAGKPVTVTVSAVNAASNLAASGWSQPAGVNLNGPNGTSMTLTPVNGKSGEYTASYQIPTGTAVNTQLTFTATVADNTGNYTNPQPQNATLTVTDKSAVKLTLTADKISGVTYGDSVVYTAEVQKNNPVLDLLHTLDGTVAFYLDEVSVEQLLATKTIGVDTLSVTLDSAKLTAGEHTVYAVYSGNIEFAAATQNVTTTVATKLLTWDASGLTAVKKYDGNNIATVSGTLLITGALEGTNPGFSYTSLSGAYSDTSAGNQTVTVTVNGAALTNSNYALPAESPTFTGKINPVSELPTPPESGNGTGYKLEQEQGISEVPGLLGSNPNLDTPAKIEAQMRVSIENAMDGVETAYIEIYDITLLLSTDSNQTWQPATSANFPAGGVTVTLPYPSGTNQYNFDFVITHMFTTGANAGTTETIVPTKTADGLKFTLHSLSPVAVGYKAATSNGGSGGRHSSGDSTDYNAEFWQSVEDKINAANNGDVIKVNAKYYDKMPYTVMDSLRKNGVTLVVDWSNGNTITIPSGEARQNESGRIYWPLSKLEELYDDVTFVETTNQAETHVNPETGGVGYIAYASTSQTVPITGSVQKVEAPIAQEQNVEEPRQMTATPSTQGITVSSAANAQNHTREMAAVLALIASAIGGCWVYRRKVTNK